MKITEDNIKSLLGYKNENKMWIEGYLFSLIEKGE